VVTVGLINEGGGEKTQGEKGGNIDVSAAVSV